jgi:N-acetyl-anhydromuramyl-L-alanine amidase AmpD
MIASNQAARYVPAQSHGGAFRQGQPRIIVIHSIECPLGSGWAYSLAVNWMQHADVSVHYIVDPSQVVQCLDEALIAWGAGTVNSAAIHIEQSGYARYSRAEWTAPDGLAQIQRLGSLVADIASRHDIPVRWLTDDQLKAAFNGAGPGGMATHSDCTRVIGGTTHTDPGPDYPRDLLLRAATGSHAEAPIPTPPEADMPLSADDLAKIKGVVDASVDAKIRALVPQLAPSKTVSVTSYVADPPVTRDLALDTVIAATYNYASAAAGRAAPTVAQIAAAIKTAPAGATADQIAAAVVRQIGAQLS